MTLIRCCALALLLPLSLAYAQDEMPAVASPATSAPAAAPAEQPAAATPAAETSPEGIGTTIIGERESPIGLYITPWHETGAEKDIDRPARLLQEKLLPIDKTVFQRQIDYYGALDAELKKKGLSTPAAR